MLGVIGRSLRGRDVRKLHALDGEAGTLDAGDDIAHVAIAHGIGLEHGVGLFDCHSSVPFLGSVRQTLCLKFMKTDG